MKAINTPTSKVLRILDNIMEGDTEWFAKDEHHSASLEYSRIGGDYEIITAKFYGTGVKVRKLNFTDIDETLGYLGHNHYYNVAGNPTEEEPAEEPATTEPASPFADLIGRKLYTYDSWNGSSCNITIEGAEQESNSVRFTGTNSYGGKSGIYVDNELLPTLLKTGKAERSREIDHCDVKTSWSLN